MKRSAALLFCAFALVSNACEKHSASELMLEHGPGGGYRAAKKAGPPGGHEQRSGMESEPAKVGAAPTFFPEKK